MSLPMTAVGPEKVETNPILTDFCWAPAGPTRSATDAAASINVLVIAILPRVLGDWTSSHAVHGRHLSGVFRSFSLDRRETQSNRNVCRPNRSVPERPVAL